MLVFIGFVFFKLLFFLEFIGEGMEESLMFMVLGILIEFKLIFGNIKGSSFFGICILKILGVIICI